MNHRVVQRALFRMQLDPGFAARVRAGEAEAAKDLGPDELALLRAADPDAVAADRDGRRRAQLLRNVSEEFALSCAAGVSADEFTSAPEFHEAVRSDASLPLAFGRYAERCSVTGIAAQRALVGLERALARARRELRPCVTPKAGEIALAPRAWLVRVPEGTLELAARLRAALDGGEPIAPLELASGGQETLLILAEPLPAPFRLRALEVERVSPDLAQLLELLREPRPRRELGDEVAEIVAELLAEGVLVSHVGS